MLVPESEIGLEKHAGKHLKTFKQLFRRFKVFLNSCFGRFGCPASALGREDYLYIIEIHSIEVCQHLANLMWVL